MIICYIDGSGNNKTRYGGCGIYSPALNFYWQKAYKETTTARMEIRALLHLLERVDLSKKYTVYCDNMYVVNAIKKAWLWRWRDEMWLERKNADLWKKILPLLEEVERSRGKVIMKWIKGHQKDTRDEHVLGNTIADQLANYKQFDEYERDER